MGNLHFSDTASDLIKMYVPERDNAMYAGYFLVSALRHAQEDVFPAECEVYHWVAKRFCEHVEGEELRSLKERIKSSGFFLNIFLNSLPRIISLRVLFENISLFPSSLPSFFNCLKIAMKGVIPAPPAIKVPFPS